MVELLQFDEKGRSLLTYTEPKETGLTPEIHGISFSAADGLVAEWEFAKSEGIDKCFVTSFSFFFVRQYAQIVS